MPKSTRRQTITTAAACLLSFPAASRAAAENPRGDADLIRLCSLMVAKRAEQDAAQEIYGELHPDTPSHDVFEARVLGLDAEIEALAPRIAAIPALTMAGVRARATALKAYTPVDYGEGSLMPVDWDHGMLAALLSDLAGDVA